jgi:signal transduction histidine kinase
MGKPAELPGEMRSRLWLTLGSFFGLEVAFKLVFVRAFGNAFAPAGDHGSVTTTYMAATVVVTLCWLVAIAAMTRRIDRLCLSADPDDRARAITALRRLPRRLALAWCLNWCATLALVAVRVPGLVSPPAVLCLLLAVGMGSSVLAHATAVWLVEEPLRVMSSDRDRVAVHVQSSLRLRVAAYGLAICGAPTMYFASLAFAARFDAMSAAELANEVLIQTAVVAGFATASAVLLARTIVGPIGRMATIMQSIAEGGRYASVERMPLREEDELGTLSEATNQMLERLEASDRERLALLASLESKVEDRTALLVAANLQVEREFQARERMQLELRQAQRLEAIGRLASGIAHEINTPVQFVGDSLGFVRTAITELTTLLEHNSQVIATVASGLPARELAAAAVAAEAEADLPYLRVHLPLALERSIEGLARVSTIVRSLRQYAHPDRAEMVACDLNQAITSTLTIARNEFRYVAELETELHELPLVTCHVGDFNQVVINLVVNAAHSITDVVGSSGHKGRLTVTSRCDGPDVVVTVGDTGGGIPAGIRDHIFDPFFTTKDVGKGTGQGLAIARAVIVDKHHGSLTFETGSTGTTFTIRIPIAGSAVAQTAAA